MKKKIIAGLMAFAAIILLLPFCGCRTCTVYDPVVKYGEFPFVIEYEKDGKHYLIEDTLVCEFDGYDPSLHSAIIWKYYTKNKSGSASHVFEYFGEGTPSLFDKERHVVRARVEINLNNPDYYMGDPACADWKPRFKYTERYNSSPNVSDVDSKYLTKGQLRRKFGIKIIRIEYSDPIENNYVELGNIFQVDRDDLKQP
ncbi:MAG: hypothetical protein E7559_04685 [Ruminococcaceae bacterium]|nr:hypothetical protein [Oscillospiraceae bacterium]